jgi:hypothetical protein
MRCRPFRLSLVPAFLWRMPLAAWLWSALVLVSVCDTNVLARFLAGQVAAAQCERAEDPEDDKDDADSADARETPPLPTSDSFSRRPLTRGFGPSLLPRPQSARRCLGDHGPALGLLPLPVPFHAGAALPLRC